MAAGSTGTEPSTANAQSQAADVPSAKQLWTVAAPTAPDHSSRVHPNTPSTRTRATSVRTGGTARSGIGAGLVRVPPTPVGEPAAAVMTDEEVEAVLGVVPEDNRFCGSCGSEVGRASSVTGDEARIKGFCGQCRAPFDFVTNKPMLERGELVAGQYSIIGPLAHGGMGWIYLGQDKGVSDRWVVLKGMLDSGDSDAVAAAVAERRFLAEVAHANIVDIYNFVTHRGAGYIVMEMVGGESLNTKLKKRREANGGIPDPLPVGEAIAYVLGILPAFAYLHDHGLVYNDLKPANIMAVDTSVKLIDLGAVMRIDDLDAFIFGTAGFQAPEVASDGPSVASDLYTVGRTLAVLMIRFVYHVGPYMNELPPPDEAPLFAQHESLYRFLLKATAKHPDDRFQSADEMAGQLRGVLREIAALEQENPRPAASELFYPDRLPVLLAQSGDRFDPALAPWRLLPGVRPDPDSPQASFLSSLSAETPTEVLVQIDEAQKKGVLQPSTDVDLRRVWELLLTNTSSAVEQAIHILERLAAEDPWDWRITWYRAIIKLRAGAAVEAAESFSLVWTDLPGETAPKFAVALAAELSQNIERAQALYDLITRIDNSFVSAAFGLARCNGLLGRTHQVVEALNRVPPSSAAHYDAQLASVKVLVAGAPKEKQPVDNLLNAASTIERLQLDAADRTSLTISMFEQALTGLVSGRINADDQKLLGQPLQERSIRKGLEAAYRLQARLVDSGADREALIDQANSVRPWSLL